MGRSWIRWSATAVVGAITIATAAQFAAAEGMLAKVRSTGTLRIGIADALPWSKVNPDGTLTGIAPLQVKAIAEALGITKVEAVVATYGQLVPGLLAGRWDMIGAGLTITPERCQQVLFSDPFYRADEGEAAAFLPGTIKDPPKTFAEMAERFDRIGMSTGARTTIMQKVIERIGSKAQMVMFTDSNLMIEGLLSKRVPIVTTDQKTMEVLKQRTKADFEVVRVDSGDPNRGAGGAFRKEDADFRDAFVAEQRKLRQSGEVKRILSQFNFVYEESFMNISGDDACKL